MSGLHRAAGRHLVGAVSAPWVSRLTGRLADARLPPWLLRAAIRAYGRLYRVDWSEVRDPIGSFKTFNAFFVRRLRAGARPIAGGPGVVVSPCDARLSAWGPVPEGGRLEQVKGMTYALEARWRDSFLPYAAGAGRGGVPQEGSQYGRYTMSYTSIPMTTAGLLGQDLWSQTSFYSHVANDFFVAIEGEQALVRCCPHHAPPRPRSERRCEQ